MKNIKLFDRRLGFSLGAASILFGTMAPAIVPAFASAESQITSRSIQMSSSVASDTGVTYGITFTPNEGTGDLYDMAIEFCQTTPLVSAPCDAPAGMAFATSTGAGAGGAGALTETGSGGTTAAVLENNAGTSKIGGANFLSFVGDLTADTASTFKVTDVTNPTAANTSFYARIYVFGTDDSSGTPDYKAAGSAGAGGSFNAAAVDGSAAITTSSDVLDDGSVALSTTNQVGVQAAVLESLQFCVFGDPGNTTVGSTDYTSNDSGYLNTLTTAANGPTDGCQGDTHTPSVTLGQSSDISVPADNVIALQTGKISYAADWAQLSTNANSGAVVYLKTDNQCVGLSRDGGTTCQIPGPDYNSSSDPSGGAAGKALATGTAGFGLQFGNVAAATDGNASGTLTANAQYTGTSAMLGDSDTTWASGSGDLNASATTPVSTTSAYGGYVFGSNQKPVANQDIPFALAATIANDTPSGLYKANLSLIAVGTF